MASRSIGVSIGPGATTLAVIPYRAFSRAIDLVKQITPDFAEAYFGKYFKIEDGKAVAYIGDNMICSRENPCDPAPMDEALAIIVDQYPMKDRILRSSGANGSGSQQSNTTGNGGAKTISRGDFERLPPAKQAEIALSRTIRSQINRKATS